MKTIKPLPPIEELRELLHYEPDTGLLRWKVSRGPILQGDVAGTLVNRYIQIKVNKKSF